jgi:hypothetical protein
MWRRTGFLCVLAALGCSADDDEQDEKTPTACEQLRDHLVDVNTRGAESVDMASYQEAMRRSLGSEFIAQCERMPAAQRDCALAATNSTAVAACGAANSAVQQH